MSLARYHKPLHSSHLCPFCGSRFSRSYVCRNPTCDTARRHSTTCPQKNGRPVPQPLKRGRRPTACDFCAASKNGCDGEPGQGCSACRGRRQPCTYSRDGNSRRSASLDTPCLSTAAAAPITPIPDTSHDSAKEHLPPADGTTYKRIPISFLLQFTDPRNDSIQQLFPSAGRSTVGEVDSTQTCSGVLDSGEHGTDADPWAWPWTGLGDPGPFEAFMDRDMFLPLPHSWRTAAESTPTDVSCASGSLHDRMDEILAALDAQSTEHRGAEADDDSSADAAAFDPLLARTIFNAQHIDALLAAYFDYWHPHCPILHRPSFDATTAFLPLLAAMAMIGATYLSQDTDDAARACLGAVETYVFGHASFQRLLSPAVGLADGDATVARLAPLQAAYTISILLNWHNHHGSRRRVRLHRYTDLVAAARHLGLPGLRHATGAAAVPCCAADWARFFRVEEAVRLMGWLFLVDSSHTIFHRMPPKLTLAELTGSLPCAEAVFALPCDAAALDAARLLSPPKVASMATAMSLLMQQPQPHNSLEDDLQRFGHLGCQDLFMLVSGLHAIIFSAAVSCALEAVTPALRSALARWKRLWDACVRSTDDTAADVRGGFYANAIEHYWLAQLFLDNGGAPYTAARPHQSRAQDQDSMEEINAFMKRFADIHLD